LKGLEIFSITGDLYFRFYLDFGKVRARGRGEVGATEVKQRLALTTVNRHEFRSWGEI